MRTSFTIKAIALGLSCLLASGVSLAETVAKYRVSVADLAVSDALSAQNKKTILNSSLLDSIENAIRNGRKFELLTRRADALAEIRKEQEFAKSGLAAGDAASEGQLSNAQSIVKVKVETFSFGRSSRKVPNLEGKYKVSDSASLALSVQIIDTTKGTVVASFPVKASSSTGESLSNGVGGASRGVLDRVIDAAAASVANQLSDTIFPITIIQVKGKNIWVNRGNDSGMKMGERFIVFEPGEALIDPQTGENLGSAETEVGEAKVTRINPKVTVLQITKGDATTIAQGFILRRPVK